METNEKKHLQLLADHLEGKLWISSDELKRRIYFLKFYIEIKLNGKITPQPRKTPGHKLSWANFGLAQEKCEEAKKFSEENVLVKIEINNN